MRASRSPRRSLPGFAVDMALRDMRRKPDPVFVEMHEALKEVTKLLRRADGMVVWENTAFNPPGFQEDIEAALARAFLVLAKLEASNG